MRAVGICIQILHTGGNGRFCTAVTRMPAARIAVPDLHACLLQLKAAAGLRKINVTSILTP